MSLTREQILNAGQLVYIYQIFIFFEAFNCLIVGSFWFFLAINALNKQNYEDDF